MIPCLIFDLDGTLVDSEPLATQVFLDLLPKLDDTVAGLMHRYTGMQFTPVVADLASRLGQALPDNFEAAYRERLMQLYDRSLVAMPGAAEVLAAMPNPKCVASNGPPSKMTHGLRVAGLTEFFGDRTFSAYQVRRWKPEPHLFLHAAHAMNYPPEMCLVVEDSDAGLQAACAAGMRAIQFAPTASAVSPLACACISHLSELVRVVERLAGEMI
jgi:HAD superfamily hydrolase (TIGR01509 family)